MSDKSPSPTKRKLRTAGNVSDKDMPAAVSQPKRASLGLSRWPVWVPFRIIGRYTIPPYLRGSWRELRQVTWPSAKQSRQLTTAVIVFSVVFGTIVAIFDYGLDRLFKQVITK